MNEEVFEKLIIRLEKAFKPLAKEQVKRDGMIEEYYSRLKDTDESLFEKAVVLMQENREYRSFPLVAEILRAINEAREIKDRPYTPKSVCGYCTDTGYVIKKCTDKLGAEMGYTQAVPCQCTIGQERRRAWAIRDKERGMRRRAANYQSAVTEATKSLPEQDPF